jgi:hypothetical protein
MMGNETESKIIYIKNKIEERSKIPGPLLNEELIVTLLYEILKELQKP